MIRKQTRTERCANELISAQTLINRAVFELNIREESDPPGRGPAPNDEYTLQCVLEAARDLATAALTLIGKKRPNRRAA